MRKAASVIVLILMTCRNDAVWERTSEIKVCYQNESSSFRFTFRKMWLVGGLGLRLWSNYISTGQRWSRKKRLVFLYGSLRDLVILE